MTELEQALEHCRGLMAAPVGADELAAAEQLFVDSIGCAFGGISDPVARGALAAMPEFPNGVAVLGSPRRLLAADSLLFHAAAIRCMDFNDIYSRRNNHHPSEFVVPIVMALAQIESWDGPRIVRATAQGYRVFLAMGEMWEGLLGRGWAPASTLGRATAAALVALLRGADDTVAKNSMAIAGVTAPTLGVVFKGQLSGMKSLVNGMAARAGWEAADLAAAGVTGPLDVFEGTAGLDAMAGGAFAVPEAGAPMLTAADVSIKAFPTVFMTHAAIAAATELAPQLTLPVKSVVVHAPEKVVTMAAAQNRWVVTDRDMAQFSLPLAVATALVHGRCGVEDLEPEVLDSPEVRGIRDAMTVLPEPAWPGYVGGRVTVTLASGEEISKEVLFPPGDPKNPISKQQLRKKFEMLAGMTYGAERAARIADEAERLGTGSGIGPLLKAASASEDRPAEREASPT